MTEIDRDILATYATYQVEEVRYVTMETHTCRSYTPFWFNNSCKIKVVTCIPNQFHEVDICK